MRLSRKSWLILAAFLLVGLAVCFVGRHALMRGYARLWVVDEPVEKADAIFVLGGGVQYRPFAAANLYHGGMAPVVLISHAKPSPTDELGITVQEKDLIREVLLKKNVPASAIQFIGSNVTSTVEETLALRDWAIAHHARRVLIPTDPAHTRRARFIFQHTLAGTEVKPVITAVEQREYSVTNWWQKEEGLIAFQNEFIKSCLYHWKY